MMMNIQKPAAANNQAVGQDTPFAGKNIVVTGKVEPYTRDEMNSLIASLGAVAGSSVSRKTDYLVCGEKAGSKLSKAQELGIRVLTPNEFFNMGWCGLKENRSKNNKGEGCGCGPPLLYRQRRCFSMKGSYFVPQVGQVYQNRNDRSYLCLSVEKRPLLNDTTAQMRRTSDGWTLTAHGLIRYEDGTIEWNYSTGGRWSESK